MDTREDAEVRRKALYGLARRGANVSGKSLDLLLADDDLYRCSDSHFSRGDVLALAQSRGALTPARRYLLAISPEERAGLLVAAHGEDALAPPAIVDWLYVRWLEYDRLVLDTSRDRKCRNRRVIRATLPRETSRAVLRSMWHEAIGPARDELLTDLEDEDADWSFPGPLSPAEVDELAQALALPPPALLERFGRRSLLQILSARLHSTWRPSRASSPPRAPTSPCELWCLHLLRRWADPELDHWIAEHAIGRRLPADRRWWLMWVLWERNRPLAATALASQYAVGDDLLPDYFLGCASDDPRESDRELFREASLPQRPARHQYLALCGLERLQEDSEPWRTRLDAWTAHPDVRLQIRAIGSLAKRGDQTSWEKLVGMAEGAPDLRVRGEAVATLGEVYPAGHLSLLFRALEVEERFFDRLCAPAAEEAALALARLGSPEARTALMHSYLKVDTDYLKAGLEVYLEAFLAPSPVGTTSIRPPVGRYWRRRGPWAWKESSA